MKDNILIYGAAGYMGQLFTQYARQAGLPIVLGSKTPLTTTETHRQFAINHAQTIQEQLHDIKLVVNLAGPFAHTQVPFIAACLQTGTHYIDIAGEAPEFAAAMHFDDAAKQAGIMLMPGAGFGVAPTDIAATLAQQQLPDATHLTLAYVTRGGVSRGTLKTVLKDIHKEGIQVVNGAAVKAAPAQSHFHFTAQGKTWRVVYNPWRADLITAIHSTGIPNVQTFSHFPVLVEQMMKGKLLWLRNIILHKLLPLLPVGPSAKQLQKGKTYVYAQVKNARAQQAEVLLQGPEAYAFTAQTLTRVSTLVLHNVWTPGFQTPSLYGKEILPESVQISILPPRL